MCTDLVSHIFLCVIVAFFDFFWQINVVVFLLILLLIFTIR